MADPIVKGKMTFEEVMQATQDEINRTEARIVKAREELLAMQRNSISLMHKQPKETYRVNGIDDLIKIFITRSFVFRIYGYSEFDAVLLKSFVSFVMKKSCKGDIIEIGRIVGFENATELYPFKHNNSTLNTRKKVVVLRSDGTKRVLALYEILDKIPKEIEFISFKSKCQLTKVDIPTKEELETKELSIITTAIRILSDEENILANAQRSESSCTVQRHARLKLHARHSLQIALASGNKREKDYNKLKLARLDFRSDAISNVPKANLQNKIEKKLQKRITDERIEKLTQGNSNEADVVEEIKRVRTVDSQIELSKFAKAHKLELQSNTLEKPTENTSAANLGVRNTVERPISSKTPLPKIKPIPVASSASKRLSAPQSASPAVTLDDLFTFHQLADAEIRQESKP